MASPNMRASYAALCGLLCLAVCHVARGSTLPSGCSPTTGDLILENELTLQSGGIVDAGRVYGRIWTGHPSGALLCDTQAPSSANPPPEFPGNESYIAAVIATDIACGIRETGSVHCTTSSTAFELGATSDAFRDVEAEGRAVCGITAAGAIKCGGLNPPAFPSTAPDGSAWAAVTLGSLSSSPFAFACGLSENHNVRCYNVNGLIEQSSITSPNTATHVYTNEFTVISAGGNYLCGAVRNDPLKPVYCNRFSLASIAAIESQTLSPGGDSWLDIRLGRAGICGLTNTGALICNSQLNTPAKPDIDGDYSMVRVGDNHACVKTKNGDITCWTSTDATADLQVNANCGRYSTFTLAGYTMCALPTEKIEPQVTIYSSVPNPTAVNPFRFHALFTEALADDSPLLGSHFQANVSGTFVNVERVSGSLLEYNIDFSPDNAGAFELYLPSNVVHDSSINYNLESNSISRYWDDSFPSVILDIPAFPGPTRVVPVFGQFVITEEVVGMDDTAIEVVSGASGTITSFFALGNNAYNFTFMPNSDGPYTLRIRPGAAQDYAGNDNLASNEVSGVVDTTAPTVTSFYTPLIPGPTNSTVIPFVVEFSEVVYGFSPTCMYTEGGSSFILTATPESGTSFEVQVYVPDDDFITVKVVTDVTDEAGNFNEKSQYNITIEIDTIPPSVVEFSTITPEPTNWVPFNFTLEYSEYVYEFSHTDVAVGGVGGTTAMLRDNNPFYIIEVTAAADGVITVEVPYGRCRDLAGNPCVETSGAITRLIDTRSPLSYLWSTENTPVHPEAVNGTNSSAIPYFVQFDEPVYGFGADDIVVTGSGGAVVNFSAVTLYDYEFVVVPASDGNLSVTYPYASAEDAATNPTIAGNTVTFEVDRVVPTVFLETPSVPATNHTFEFTVTYSEDIFHFVIDDMLRAPGLVLPADSYVSNLVVYSRRVFTFEVLPAADGYVTFQVPQNAAMDDGWNGNLPSNSVTLLYDTVRPTALLDCEEYPGPTLEDTLHCMIQWSEDVYHFDAGDIVARVEPRPDVAEWTGDDTIASFGVDNFDEIESRRKYSFTVTPPKDGYVTVDIREFTATDLALNGISSNTTTIEIDTTPPYAVIHSDAAHVYPQYSNVIDIELEFSEPIATLTMDSLITFLVIEPYNIGYIYDFERVTPSFYTFKFLFHFPGNASFDTVTDVYTDVAGNNNSLIQQNFRVYYVVIPPPQFTPTEIGLMAGGSATVVLTVVIIVCLVRRYKRKVGHRVKDASYFVAAQQRRLAKAMVVEVEETTQPNPMDNIYVPTVVADHKMER